MGRCRPSRAYVRVWARDDFDDAALLSILHAEAEVNKRLEQLVYENPSTTDIVRALLHSLLEQVGLLNLNRKLPSYCARPRNES